MAIVVKQPGVEQEAAHKHGYSAVLYGPALVGKTTTLALDPDFTYILVDIDKNTTTLNESPNVTILSCDTFQDYLDVKENVRKGWMMYNGKRIELKADCVVIDSFTSLEEKIKKHVVDVFTPERRREVKGRFGVQSDWGDLQEFEIEEVRDWQSMTKRKVNPINVIWIGHDLTVTNDMGMAVGTAIALQGKYAAPRIGSAVDAMFYMFKAEKDIKDAAGKKTGTEVGRFIRTQQAGIIQAETRMPIARRGEMPPVIKDPKWSEVFKIMGYQK